MFESLLGGGDTPTLKQAALDSGTVNQINKAVADAGQSDNEMLARYSAGVADAGKQAGQSEDQANQRAAQTGENNGLMQAIRNQYNQLGNKGVNRVATANQLNLPFQRSHAIDLATKAAFAQKQVETQNNMALMQASNDAEIARANVLYGVLSGAGTLGGAYLGASMRGGKESVRPNTPSDDTIDRFNGPKIDSIEGGIASRVPFTG